MGAQVNEFEIDTARELDFQPPEDYGDENPAFYQLPKYTPLVNMIPGGNTEYHPPGSLTKAKEDFAKVSMKAKTNDILTKLSANMSKKRVEAKQTPEMSTKHTMSKGRPSEELIKEEVIGSPKAQKGKNHQLQVVREVDVHSISSDSDTDFEVYLSKLTQEQAKPLSSKEKRLDKENRKDYQLFSEDSDIESSSKDEENKGSKSQEIQDKQTISNSKQRSKRSKYNMHHWSEKAKAVEMAMKVGVKAAAEV